MSCMAILAVIYVTYTIFQDDWRDVLFKWHFYQRRLKHTGARSCAMSAINIDLLVARRLLAADIN